MHFEKKISNIEETPHFREKINNQNYINDNKLLTKLPKNYKNCRFILLDTETTGLDIKMDKLVSINAVEMINGELTGIQFNAYLNKRFNNNTKPLMYYLSDYNYSRKDNIKKSLETFLSFVSDSIVITHNALFDMKFINKELKKYELPEIPLCQCFCTLKMFNNLKKIGRLNKNFKLRLCDLCRYYGINVDPNDLHQGLVDVIVFGRIFAIMLEDGIYNGYDNYDFDEDNSFINYTNIDINYNFGSSIDEINNNINEEKIESKKEKDIVERPIICRSKEKNNKSKINISKSFDKKNNNKIVINKKYNKSYDKNYKKKEKEIKFKKNKNHKNNNSGKENFFNENTINNINNNKYFFKNCLSARLNNKFSNEGYNNSKKQIKTNREEPKLSFLKYAFKKYISNNKEIIKYKNT